MSKVIGIDEPVAGFVFHTNQLIGHLAHEQMSRKFGQRGVAGNTMLLNGSLYPHLMEVEQTAESQMQQTMQGLLKQNPAPNKEQHQMGWVQHMNSLKAQAEELVLTELIYS